MTREYRDTARGDRLSHETVNDLNAAAKQATKSKLNSYGIAIAGQSLTPPLFHQRNAVTVGEQFAYGQALGINGIYEIRFRYFTTIEEGSSNSSDSSSSSSNSSSSSSSGSNSTVGEISSGWETDDKDGPYFLDCTDFDITPTRGTKLIVFWDDQRGMYLPLTAPGSGSGGSTCPPSNAIWGIVIIGLPAAGTFKIRFHTDTSDLPHNVSVAALQSALEALPAIGSGNVRVTGADAGYNYHVEFIRDLANEPITAFQAVGTNLLGHGVGIATYLIQQGRS